MIDEPPMVTAARRSFAASVDEDDGPSVLPAWALSCLIAIVCFGGPTVGSVLGLAIILQLVALPAVWSWAVALIWTGAAVGWATFLLRGRP